MEIIASREMGTGNVFRKHEIGYVLEYLWINSLLTNPKEFVALAQETMDKCFGTVNELAGKSEVDEMQEAADALRELVTTAAPEFVEPETMYQKAARYASEIVILDNRQDSLGEQIKLYWQEVNDLKVACQYITSQEDYDFYEAEGKRIEESRALIDQVRRETNDALLICANKLNDLEIIKSNQSLVFVNISDGLTYEMRFSEDRRSIWYTLHGVENAESFTVRRF
jgi:hypothetical protein